MELIIKKCLKCGAAVEVLHDCTCDNCGIKCCGEEMKTFKENKEDASFEKHIPVIAIEGNKIVAHVPHVMEEDHYIEWIAYVDDKITDKRFLKPGEEAKVEFPYKKGGKVYEFCNKHGLWSTEVK